MCLSAKQKVENSFLNLLNRDKKILVWKYTIKEGINLIRNAFFRHHWLLFIIVIFAIYGCADTKTENDKGILSPIALLPVDNEISGWNTLGVYVEADDYQSLYDIIDGGAQVYIDNGFMSGAFQIYTNFLGGSSDVTVRIYDQGTEANARIVYDKIATGIGIPWSGAGKDARIDESALACYTIEFWQGNFFIQVIIEQKSDEALNIAKLFASHISQKIG